MNRNLFYEIVIGTRHCNIDMLSAPTKNITTNTIIISTSMNRNVINAMAIRSPQVKIEDVTGGGDDSVIGALKSASEHVP